jgi:subtilisin family serine protease
MQNKKSDIFIALFLLLLNSFTYASLEIQKPELERLNYAPGQIIIKTAENAPDNALELSAYSLGAVLVKKFTLVPGLSLYEFNQANNLNDVVTIFESNTYVEYAEPNYYYTASLNPNDQFYNLLWALENTGQSQGTPDADINAQLMWEIQEGRQAIVVGVIDTGVDYTHTDLVANLWRNTLEIPNNNIDDDHNGYIDDIHGINAIFNNGNPMDDHAHGTHVSGTIGADGNNHVGVVGVAHNVQIAHCKFLGASGGGVTTDAIECLQYFAELKSRAQQPVNLIATNNSWGSSWSSNALRDAILAHQNLGILFIAAAGNNSRNVDLNPNYPSNYDLSNIISVAATDHNDMLASFSNYGDKTVHVAAPGVRILSTVLHQGYAFFNGTSMATPQVTGLAAIIKSEFPNFNYKQIKNLILSSGTPLAALNDKVITGRRIRGADTNNRGALTCINQSVNARLKPIESSTNLVLGESIFLSSLRLNCHMPAGTQIVYNDGIELVLLQDNGQNGDVISNDGIFSRLWQPARAQTYNLNFGNGDILPIIVRSQAPFSP